jgi:hypothetical protein
MEVVVGSFAGGRDVTSDGRSAAVDVDRRIVERRAP